MKQNKISCCKSREARAPVPHSWRCQCGDTVRVYHNIHCVPVKTSSSYFMNNSVKNQVIWMISGKQKPEEISRNYYLACPPRLTKCYHCTLWKIDVIKFPMFPSKIGCILNSQLLNHTRQVKFQTSKIAEIVKSVIHVCAPSIVKIDWFLTEMFKK